MPRSIRITAPDGPLRARIDLPRAKSVANRALVLADLAGDRACVHGPGNADDTRILLQLLRERGDRMHCGDGGTTLRFLLAWACVQAGEERLITGNPRLMQRPHAPLVEALCTLGADITAHGDGFRVRGRDLRGGSITLHSPASSQFISALLLVAPRFAEGLHLHWTGLRLSEPYVRMTVKLLQYFGAEARMEGEVVHVAPGPLKDAPFHVPGDWSAAAFWHELVALAPGSSVLLEDLEQDGLQGDEATCTLFADLVIGRPTPDGRLLEHSAGSSGPFHANLINTPDLFQPLAFTMAALGRKAGFTGLHNLSLKETDRLHAVADALAAMDCTARYADGNFLLSGPITADPLPPFDPQGDHRMAMALAPLALVRGAVTILHPEVVGKSYPGFWDDLARAGFKLERH
jgi:3-phosphoshikimate 1-carboxyvinyltransferase